MVLAIGASIAILLEGLLRYGRAVLFTYLGDAIESGTVTGLMNHAMRADAAALRPLGAPALLDGMRAGARVLVRLACPLGVIRLERWCMLGS